MKYFLLCLVFTSSMLFSLDNFKDNSLSDHRGRTLTEFLERQIEIAQINMFFLDIESEEDLQKYWYLMGQLNAYVEVFQNVHN